MSQPSVGAPTGMSSLPTAAPPKPPQVVAVSSGSMYLRFKREKQTIFLHCEPSELLSAIKFRLAAVLGLDEEDVRLYEYMSAERKAQVMAAMEEKVREAAKLAKKKPGVPKPNVDEEIAKLEIPPLPEEKKLWELGLENDAIVFFVLRTHPKTDWDEWEEPNVPGLQAGSGKLLGSCAYQIPGGDGFDEPGTAARREAQRAEEEAKRAAEEQAKKEAEEREMREAAAAAASEQPAQQ